VLSTCNTTQHPGIGVIVGVVSWGIGCGREKRPGHTHTHTHTHTRKHTHTHTNKHTQTHTQTHTHTHAHVHAHTLTHSHTHTHTHRGLYGGVSLPGLAGGDHTGARYCCHTVLALLLHCSRTVVTLLLSHSWVETQQTYRKQIIVLN
jgi:hypothetical protein